jgi:hypothetical protein
MPATAEAKFTNLFDQAVQSFGDALKTSVKIQEDAAKWWSDVLDQGSAVQEFQKRSCAIVNESLPVAQKSAEDYFKVIEQNYRRGMDLLKKATNTENVGAAADMRAKSQELWETSMEAVRDSAQAMAQANVKLMEQWADVLRKNLNGEIAPLVAA